MIVEKFYTYCYNCFEGGEKMNIGKIIKERREEIGMSQEELAIKLGYKSRSSINKIERDGRGLPQGKIKAIADALNTTPSHIMGWDIESEEGKTIFEINTTEIFYWFQNEKNDHH